MDLPAAVLALTGAEWVDEVGGGTPNGWRPTVRPGRAAAPEDVWVSASPSQRAQRASAGSALRRPGPDRAPSGHQARVFRASGGRLAGDVAVKAVDARLVDAAEHAARRAAVADLAERTAAVGRPGRLGGRLVTEADTDDGPMLVTIDDWIDGRPLDPAAEADTRRLGRTLATVHDAMRQVDARPLPPVAALCAVPLGPGWDDQMLHGDVNVGNVRVAGADLRLIDLDGCGRGPARFDVADALYMARFASEHDPASAGSYPTFAAGLVAGYAEATGAAVDPEVLSALMAVRLRAVLVWLDDLATAPVGIRATGPAWHEVLRAHVARHLPA